MLTDLRGNPPCVSENDHSLTKRPKDQSNLLYLVPNIDTVQYVDASNEDTNQQSKLYIGSS